MPASYGEFSESALPPLADKRFECYQVFVDKHLKAGDHISLGICVSSRTLSSLFSKADCAQDDSDDEDDDGYVEVALKTKEKPNWKASIVKITQFAGLSALPRE